MVARIGQVAAWALALLLVAAAALWLFFPREPVDRIIAFDATTLPDAAGLDAYLARQEARFDDIRPGQQRAIHWAGAPGARTVWAVLYVHGYTASPSEIRPVPDRVARGLGANLHYLRLRGHARDGDALAEAVAGDWLEDMAEGLAIARRLGERVLVVATSFGAALTSAAVTDPRLAGLAEDVAGVVLIAPAYGLDHPLAPLLELPGARQIGPLIAGAEQEFPIKNEEHARHWTTRYPTVAAAPMAAAMRYARRLDPSTARVPALFVLAEEDRVIDLRAARKAARLWGAPARMLTVTPGAEDDPNGHVLGGDILSPGLTGPVTEAILDWAGALDGG
jgi:alpha-beta hydrolase superfamily lysophospholipase